MSALGGSAETPELVSALLSEYGEATRVALCEYLAPREPQRHLYTLVADYPRRGGRMLRPSLCIANARLFGAPLARAVRVAAALELMHNAFLVHDDIEDESLERRGRPTLHALHGVPIAINVGDALSVLGLRALVDNAWRLGPVAALQLLQEAERMARETVEGQAVELGWRRDNALHTSEADYLAMVLKKTCWYTTIFPSRAGFLIGRREANRAESFVRFGFFLGAAFQIRDDLLNLESSARGYGKELAGDLWEGKRTLMLIHLLERASAAERDRIGEFLALPRAQREAGEVAWLAERMEAVGALAHARRAAHALAGAALSEFETCYGSLPDSRDKRFVAELPRWVLERS